MIYQTIDGRVFHAEGPATLVCLLRKSSWSPTPDEPTFMREMAARCYLWNGSRVRYDTPEHFVADLIEGGIVIALPTN